MEIISFFINFIILFLLLKCEVENLNSNDSLLEWGLKNKLNLSSYIEIKEISKTKMKFIAKTDIPSDKDLLIIPYSLMFNISKTMELINLLPLKKQFEDFQKLNNSFFPEELESRKEKPFLSYIFYLINHKKKKYKKTKFYQFYQKYLDLLRKYYPKSTLFYSGPQIQYLAGTFLDRMNDIIKGIFQGEVEIFSNKTYYKKLIDFDEYTQHRLAINKYGINISNHWTLVPFLNCFDDNYDSFNANYSIEENGDMRIYSIQNIKKGEPIVLMSKKKTNIMRLITEGQTSEKLVDYYPIYQISAFSPGLYYQYGINDKSYYDKYIVNILEEDIYSKLLNIYKNHSNLLQGDGSDTWAYDILEMNLNFYKEHFEGITMNKIYEIYIDSDDRINIERIIRGERKIIETIYDKANKIIDKYLENLEKQESKKNKKDSDL